MSLLQGKPKSTPFVGYGVIPSRIWNGGKLRGFSTWAVFFLAIMFALVLLNTTLSKMYEDYYNSRQVTNKKVLELQIELTNLKMKHIQEYNEMRDMLFSHQIMELTRRVTDGNATLEEKAWLEFLKKKKQDYTEARAKEEIVRNHEMTDVAPKAK